MNGLVPRYCPECGGKIIGDTCSKCFRAYGFRSSENKLCDVCGGTGWLTPTTKCLKCNKNQPMTRQV